MTSLTASGLCYFIQVIVSKTTVKAWIKGLKLLFSPNLISLDHILGQTHSREHRSLVLNLRDIFVGWPPFRFYPTYSHSHSEPLLVFITLIQLCCFILWSLAAIRACRHSDALGACQSELILGQDFLDQPNLSNK